MIAAFVAAEGQLLKLHRAKSKKHRAKSKQQNGQARQGRLYTRIRDWKPLVAEVNAMQGCFTASACKECCPCKIAEMTVMQQTQFHKHGMRSHCNCVTYSMQLETGDLDIAAGQAQVQRLCSSCLFALPKTLLCTFVLVSQLCSGV